MIFVLLGTEERPFERMLDWIEPLVGDETVVVQHGTTEPRSAWPNAEWEPFMTYDDVLQRIRSARAVVSHAGVGSIVTCLREGVRPIVAARTQAAGEHVDDHQEQIVRVLGAEGLVTVFASARDLATALRGSSTRHQTRGRGPDSRLSREVVRATYA